MTPADIALLGIKETLRREIWNENYKFLKCLCKKFKAGITAEEVFVEDKVYYSTPDVQFYWDLYSILCRDMESRVDDYISAYIDFHRITYNKAYDEILSLDFDKIDKAKYAKNIIWKASNDDCEIKDIFQMVVFLSRAKCDAVVLNELKNLIYDPTDENIPDKEYIKNVIENIVLAEGELSAYIEECRKNLADRLGIKERKLNDFFRQKIVADINQNELDFTKGATYAAIQTLIANNNGSTVWYDVSLTKKKENNQKKLYYILDIDRIICSYYESQIAMIAMSLRSWMNKNKNIFKDLPIKSWLGYKIHELRDSGDKKNIEMAELIENKNPVEWASSMVSLDDEKGILRLASIDVVYHLFDYTLKKLYEEKLKSLLYDAPVKHENPDSKKIELLKQEIEKLKGENKKLSDERQTFKRKYSELKEKVDRDAAFEEELFRQAQEDYRREIEMNPEEYERDQMLLEMERQDKERYESEMSRLKRLLKEREEYIDNLKTEKQLDIDDTEKIPLDELYLYKYLFVGDLSISGFQELRYKFPESKFVEKETADLKNVSADYMVLIIPSMSHALFYKLDSYKNLRFIPRIHYNGKNLSGLLDAMASEIYKIQNTETNELDEMPEWEPW